MKLLLDQALPYTAVSLLIAKGVDTIHVRDIGYSAVKDEVIIEKARELARVIVTYDADFHALIALSGEKSPSVIRIRIEGIRGTVLVDLLEWIIEQCETQLREGALVTVQEDCIRIRKLPIVKN